MKLAVRTASHAATTPMSALHADQDSTRTGTTSASIAALIALLALIKDSVTPVSMATTRFVPVVAAKHAISDVELVALTLTNARVVIPAPTFHLKIAKTVLVLARPAIHRIIVYLAKTSIFWSRDNASPAVPSAPDATGEAAALNAMLPTCSK